MIVLKLEFEALRGDSQGQSVKKPFPWLKGDQQGNLKTQKEP